jgi:hypothetical protein
MPEIESFPRLRKRARLLFEISLSIYFPLLFIMANAVRSVQHPAKNSWVDDLQSLTARGWYTPSYHFAFSLLWLISAVILFICLRMLARLSFLDVFLRIFAGIVVVAGFPLASGYLSFRGYLGMFASPTRAVLYAYSPHRWLAVEVMASLMCVLGYVFLKWPTEARWGVPLLGLHFAVWSWFVITAGQESLLIYPFLGLLASIAWGAYVRLAEESPLLPQRLPAPSSSK